MLYPLRVTMQVVCHPPSGSARSNHPTNIPRPTRTVSSAEPEKSVYPSADSASAYTYKA